MLIHTLIIAFGHVIIDGGYDTRTNPVWVYGHI